MRLSYIVSVYNDASRLPCCLWSLKAQTNTYYEIIVTDNSEDPVMAKEIEEVCRSISSKIRYFNCRLKGCYHSAEFGVSKARGDFLCFPSDDSYFMPLHAEVMLATANNFNVDFVTCDIVYDPRCGHGRYSVVTGATPKIGWLDKTQFILKRSQFTEFPAKDDYSSPSADGLLGEQLLQRGVSFMHIPDILAVHN